MTTRRMILRHQLFRRTVWTSFFFLWPPSLSNCSTIIHFLVTPVGTTSLALDLSSLQPYFQVQRQTKQFSWSKPPCGLRCWEGYLSAHKSLPVAEDLRTKHTLLIILQPALPITVADASEGPAGKHASRHLSISGEMSTSNMGRQRPCGHEMSYCYRCRPSEPRVSWLWRLGWSRKVPIWLTTLNRCCAGRSISDSFYHVVVFERCCAVKRGFRRVNPR